MVTGAATLGMALWSAIADSSAIALSLAMADSSAIADAVAAGARLEPALLHAATTVAVANPMRTSGNVGIVRRRIRDSLALRVGGVASLSPAHYGGMTVV
jgi:hypothetical protein